MPRGPVLTISGAPVPRRGVLLWCRDWDRYLLFAPSEERYFRLGWHELAVLLALGEGGGFEAAVARLSSWAHGVSRDSVVPVVAALEEAGLVREGRPVHPVAHGLESLGREGDGSPDRPPGSIHCQTPRFVSIDLTTRCNLECAHCRTDARRNLETALDPALARRLLEELSSMRVFSVQFSGGEPLLHPAAFELLAEARRLDPSWLVKLATNGTLLTEERVEALAALPVDLVSVSLDGFGRAHDRFRRSANAFDLTIQGLRRLAGRGLRVLVNTVLHRGNVDEFERLVDFVDTEVGPSGHRVSVIFPAGRGREDPSQYFDGPERLAIWERYLAIRDRYPGLVLRAPFLDLPPSPPESDLFLAFTGCVAGKSHCSIQADGTVSPCKLALDHHAGRLPDRSLLEVWHSDGFEPYRSFTGGDLLDPACRGCRHLASCRGGCRVVARRLGDGIASRDPWCRMVEFHEFPGRR